jgi:drug/metabolite transporter (DMT)-like permease
MPVASVTPRGGVAAALAVVYIAWGSTFVAMRVAVRALPPLTMSGARFLAAGLLLYCWCLWQRHRHPEAGWRGPTRRRRRPPRDGLTGRAHGACSDVNCGGIPLRWET